MYFSVDNFAIPPPIEGLKCSIFPKVAAARPKSADPPPWVIWQTLKKEPLILYLEPSNISTFVKTNYPLFTYEKSDTVRLFEGSKSNHPLPLAASTKESNHEQETTPERQ